MAEIDEQDTSVATNDAYTGMLAISLVALLLGCALLYLDYDQYGGKDPPKVSAPTPKFNPPTTDGAAPVPQGNPMPMPMEKQPMPAENKDN